MEQGRQGREVQRGPASAGADSLLDLRPNRLDLRAQRRNGLSIVVHPRRFAAADTAVRVGERDHDHIECGFGAARHAKRDFVRPGLRVDVHPHERAVRVQARARLCAAAARLCAAARNSSTCARGVAYEVTKRIATPAGGTLSGHR